MNWDKNKVLAYLGKLVGMQDDIDTEAASQSIRKNVLFRGPNVFILFFAIIVASVGLNVNSIPVIIGAMLISPLMGPIIGFGLGLGINDTDLVKSALKNLAIMVGISLLASTLYFLLTPLSLAHPTELLARTKPTIYDVFIALFGGFAGILEISRKERGTVMSGVAIATALMPPLCTAGFGLATLQWSYMFGALYLFLLNSILIALATFLTVKYLKYPTVERQHDFTRRRVVSIVLAVLILIVPSVITAVRVVRENSFEMRATAFIEQHKVIGNSYVYQTDIDAGASRVDFYLAGEALSDADRKLFLAQTIESGFDTAAIVLHEDALQADNSGLLEQTLVKDLFASKEEQLLACQTQIAELQRQLDAARQTYPGVATSQLAREVQSQWPQVTHVSLALGEMGSVLPDSVAVSPLTIVRLQSSSPLSSVEKDRIERWLQVRLGVSEIVLWVE